MNVAVAVAVGGAVGALARYWMTAAVTVVAGHRFPWGTLSLHVLGVLLLGVLCVVVVARTACWAAWCALMSSGGFGAVSACSAVSIHALLLVQSGRVVSAEAYVLTSVVVCLLAVAGSISLVRMV